MRRPPLNTLRMFDAAARHLNFRLAAEELHLTQGAVAQQVRRLEADLAVLLFTRQARGLSLTQKGAAYHRAIQRALHIIETATADLAPESRRVTLSVPPSFATKWLVPRLADFSRLNPDIDLTISASETLANFQSDGTDLAIRQTSPPFAAHLQAEFLAPLSLCAVTSPLLASQLPARPTLADLLEQPLIEDSHRHWHALLDGPPKQRVLSFNQTALAMDAAANGQGIALAPLLLAQGDIASGRLTPVWRAPAQESRGFFLIRPAKAPPNPHHDTVTQWIMAAISSP